jgi:hypothetical protein
MHVEIHGENGGLADAVAAHLGKDGRYTVGGPPAARASTE